MHSYDDVVDSVPMSWTLHPCDCSVTAGLRRLALPPSTQPPTPLPLWPLSVCSLSVSLLQFCVFVYIVL